MSKCCLWEPAIKLFDLKCRLFSNNPMACAATGALTYVTQHFHDSVYDINSHCSCQPDMGIEYQTGPNWRHLLES